MLVFLLCTTGDGASLQKLSPAAEQQVHRLANGLTLIIAPDTTLPIVSVAVSYHVGVANEDSGRTEFSHLFEHLMFMGSQHVPRGEHTRRIQDAGGRADATTDFDRTYYYEQVPANHLEVVLWLESDRMGFMPGAITQQALELQRSVVESEHRQRRLNAPYGMAFWRALSTLYPPDHPYAIPADNWLADLGSATLEDVRSFFRRFYGPNNATIAIVGDIDPQATLHMVQRYFGDIPQGPTVVQPEAQPVRLDLDKYVLLEDQVEIPALLLMWPTDRVFSSADAELQVLARILADGAGSRLYRKLVERDRSAQSVTATQEGWGLAGQLIVEVRGVPQGNLTPIRKAVDEEIAKLSGTLPATDREVARAINQIERSMAQRRESRLRRAMDLTMYHTFTGNAAYESAALARYRQVTPASVQEAARRYLAAHRVVLSVVPRGQPGLQAVR
jgi:zinc protease